MGVDHLEWLGDGDEEQKGSGTPANTGRTGFLIELGVELRAKA